MAAPDDDDDEQVDDEHDDELIDFAALDDEEGERRLAEYAKRFPPPRRELPPDLRELYERIRDGAVSRKLFHPETPPYLFEGFEAYDALIGGMGLVIEARDPELERKVAIKLWKQAGPEAQQALLHEAKILARLTHRNVVMVYETRRCNLADLVPPHDPMDGGDPGERVLFVMEWIEGVNGQEWMGRSRSWREVRDVFVQAGQGLAAAHDEGIQHRDFKPANMLVGDDGRVVVADFGIADSLRNVENTDPRWGTPAGTPAYMAPERLCGEPGDARSDQFSFCVAMWRALYGVRPFAGEEVDELLEAIELGELRVRSGVGVPRWLNAVLSKGLAADPEDRHPSMHELIAALLAGPADTAEDDEAVGDEGEPIAGERLLHRGRVRTQGERWPYAAIGFLAALVGVMGVMVVTVVGGWWPEPRAVGETVGSREVEEVEPYYLVLGLISADEFTKARRMWSQHQSEWSDDQSLRIARECLDRASKLTALATEEIEGATRLAHEAASSVAAFGDTPQARKAGDQLTEEIKAWLVTRRHVAD
ncbi:MAG: serine/threonine-protein kinase [Enhygromyxa sp.]